LRSSWKVAENKVWRDNMTEDLEFFKIEKDSESKVTKVIFDRPPVNAIHDGVLDELNKVIDMLWNDVDTRVIVITGGGEKAFSAGADVAGGNIPTNHFEFLEFNRKGERIYRRLSEIPKPVIAAINGYALGGGCELALACDIRLAKKKVQLGFPEVTLGIVPGWGGTQRTVKLIGMSKAMEMVLTGERITAEEAAKFGLINRVYDDDKFDEEVMNFAKNMAKMCAPISMAIAKRLVNKGGEVPMDIGLEMESFGAGLMYPTEDMQEGMMARMEKRPPNFKGI
jgi:enoyl-CoA hydratase/3-hydroxyacyl-CoA dehydrogenase